MRKHKPIKSLTAARKQAQKVRNTLYGIEHRNCSRKIDLKTTDSYFEERAVLGEKADNCSSYRVNRTYAQYNTFFSQGLSAFFKRPTTVMSALEYAAKNRPNKNRPFTILEDGAGMGIALAEITQTLRAKGIPTHSIALTLSDSHTLREAQKQGKISEIKEQEAEDFVPRRAVNAIISYAGSITHVLNEVKKDHLLKMAYCLDRGGIMIASFHRSSIPAKGKLLAQDPKKYLEGIAQAFRKRGFRAVVVLNKINWKRNVKTKKIEINSDQGATAHSHMLILQRIK